MKPSKNYLILVLMLNIVTFSKVKRQIIMLSWNAYISKYQFLYILSEETQHLCLSYISFCSCFSHPKEMQLLQCSFFIKSFPWNKVIQKPQRSFPRQIVTFHQSPTAQKMVTSAFKWLIYSTRSYKSALNLKFSSGTLLWT